MVTAEGELFEIVRLSDVERDAMCLELTALRGEHPGILAEAVWHDPTSTFTVRWFVGTPVPFEVAEWFLASAGELLPPSPGT